MTIQNRIAIDDARFIQSLRAAAEALPGPDAPTFADAFVWFEETRAVTPLGHERPRGAPETWPFGL